MDAPVGKEYAGPSGIGRDSVWLTAEDLIEGTDATAQIESVIVYAEVTFQGGRKRANMLGLKFVGKTRVLGLNATNRKALNSMFGNITSAWKGQKVTMYVTDTQLAGESVKCVRIRNKGSRVASAAEQFLAGEDAEPKGAGVVEPERPAKWTEEQWGKFKEACSAMGVSADDQAYMVKFDPISAMAELNARAAKAS